jgi:hypothetical protein
VSIIQCEKRPLRTERNVADKDFRFLCQLAQPIPFFPINKKERIFVVVCSRGVDFAENPVVPNLSTDLQACFVEIGLQLNKWISNKNEHSQWVKRFSDILTCR